MKQTLIKSEIEKSVKNVEKVSEVLILIIMLLLSIEDIKHMKIKVSHLCCSVLAMLLIDLIMCGYEGINVYELAGGILISGLIGFLGMVSKGIGGADIVVIFFLGIVFKTEMLLMGIILSLLLIYIAAIFTAFKKGLNRKTRFPYIPYLTLGMILTML